MKIIDLLLDLLYPPRCMLCQKVLKHGRGGICEKCADKLPQLRTDECRRDLNNISLCVFTFRYKDEIRESLHRFKFRGAAAYGPIYADFILKSIDENQISCDIISWVPIHKKRYRERGYDQSELIAQALSEKLGIPCKRLLVKVKHNKRQSSLNDREARSKNVIGAYRCVVEAEELQGKRVLLVDDIVTSGSTIKECARMLKASGCTEICAAAVAAVSS